MSFSVSLVSARPCPRCQAGTNRTGLSKHLRAQQVSFFNGLASARPCLRCPTDWYWKADRHNKTPPPPPHTHTHTHSPRHPWLRQSRPSPPAAGSVYFHARRCRPGCTWRVCVRVCMCVCMCVCVFAGGRGAQVRAIP